MSKVTRYEYIGPVEYYIKEDTTGEFVLFDDYQDLKGQLAEACAARDQWRSTNLKLTLAIDTLKNASRILDGIKSECYASVYTVEDDEFTQIYFVRDLIDNKLKELGEHK